MKRPAKQLSFLIMTGLSLLLTSCANQKTNTVKNKTEDIPTSEGKFIVTAPVIFKDFVKKNGEATGHKEVYLQQSIQDYFIKFCESKVTKEDLEKHLSKIRKVTNAATLEIEYREGYWDICNDNFAQQSRIGKYVIIHRIVENN